MALVDGLKNAGANVRRAGSGTLGIAYVADGRIDAYCELHINSWDALAALLLVDEAGGWTNNFLAKDGLRSGNPVLACTPASGRRGRCRSWGSERKPSRRIGGRREESASLLTCNRIT